MKIFLSVLGIILGILFFRVGHVLINSSNKTISRTLTIEDYWNKEIVLKNGRGLSITLDSLFNKVPVKDRYPVDNNVYFRLDSKRQTSTKLVVTSSIIKNNESLFKNQYYFNLNKSPQLLKIINEDLTTGETLEIKDSGKLASLISIYSDFIDLY